MINRYLFQYQFSLILSILSFWNTIFYILARVILPSASFNPSSFSSDFINISLDLSSSYHIIPHFCLISYLVLPFRFANVNMIGLLHFKNTQIMSGFMCFHKLNTPTYPAHYQHLRRPLYAPSSPSSHSKGNQYPDLLELVSFVCLTMNRILAYILLVMAFLSTVYLCCCMKLQFDHCHCSVVFLLKKYTTIYQFYCKQTFIFNQFRAIKTALLCMFLYMFFILTFKTLWEHIQEQKLDNVCVNSTLVGINNFSK